MPLVASMKLNKCTRFYAECSFEGPWFDSELPTTENYDTVYQLQDHWTEYKWWDACSGRVNYGPTVDFVLRRTAFRQVSIIPDTSRGFNPQRPHEIFFWAVHICQLSLQQPSPLTFPMWHEGRKNRGQMKWNEQPLKVNVFTHLVYLLFSWDCKFHFQHCEKWDHKNVKWNQLLC